jgi:Flp pilus assembly protein TadD
MVSPLSAVKQKRLLWATTVVALLAPVAAVGARWRDGVKAAEQVRAGERVLDAPMDEAPTPEQLEAGRAEALFGRAVSLDPGDARTRRARALWHAARAYGDLARGELVLAATESQTALREAPEEPRVLLAAAVVDLRRGEVGRAERRFDQVERTPGVPTTVRVRSAVLHVDVLLDGGRAHEALTLAEDVARVAGDSAAVQNRLGLARAAVGDRDGARAAFERARVLAPGSATPFVNLARISRAAGDLPGARRMLERAVALAESDGEAWLAYGVVLSDLGGEHASAARSAILRAARLMPDAAGPWRAQGDLDLRAGRLNDAVESFREALQRDANDTASRTNLGVALARQGDRRAAMMAFEEVTQRAPSTGEAWNGLGAMRLASDDAPGAVGPLQQATVLLPDDPNPPMNLGLALERLQRWDDAARAFRECLRRAPAHEAAARHLAALQPGAATQRRSAHATGPSPAPSAVVRAPRLAAR